jgi:phosphoribosyl 1,2-cyclic phosphodiesterase
MSAETAAELKLVGYRIKTVAQLKQFQIGTFLIVPFNLPHTNTDGTNCPNFGFILYSTATNERLLYATDCMYIPNRFPACQYYMVEVNYSGDVENDHRIPEVEKRRYRSHMSLDTAYSFLQAQELSKCKAIYCLHLSAAASNEQEIRERMGMLNKEVIIC